MFMSGSKCDLLTIFNWVLLKHTCNTYCWLLRAFKLSSENESLPKNKTLHRRDRVAEKNRVKLLGDVLLILLNLHFKWILRADSVLRNNIMRIWKEVRITSVFVLVVASSAIRDNPKSASADRTRLLSGTGIFAKFIFKVKPWLKWFP